jgi:hypothetical protein
MRPLTLPLAKWTTMAEFPLGDNSMHHLGTDPTPQQPEYNAAKINREIASINMREGKSIGFFVERDLNGDASFNQSS